MRMFENVRPVFSLPLPFFDRKANQDDTLRNQCLSTFRAFQKCGARGIEANVSGEAAKELYTHVRDSLKCDDYMSPEMKRVRDDVARFIVYDQNFHKYGLDMFRTPAILFGELQLHAGEVVRNLIKLS